MIPAAFDYVRAESIEDALEALGASDVDAKLLAGGHSLLPLMKLRLASPQLLIDIGRIDELRTIEDHGDYVAIGALARHGELASSPLVRATVPLLSAAAEQIGDPQVRHQGTIGGSIVHGDPASDLPAALIALGGSCVVRDRDGFRIIGADDMFVGFLETAISPDEILTEVRVPKSDGLYAFEKFTRRAQDWAVVGVAAQRSEHGTGVALVNMSSTPIRAVAVQEALESGARATEAAAAAPVGTSPVSDLNASGEYRTHLATVLCRRALETLGY